MKCVYKKCMNSVIATNHGHKVSNVALVYNCKFNTLSNFIVYVIMLINTSLFAMLTLNLPCNICNTLNLIRFNCYIIVSITEGENTKKSYILD